MSFVLCTGSADLRGDDDAGLQMLRELERDGHLRVERGLSKAAYYGVLRRSRVLLNTARQDFVSNTAIEASALGAMAVAPAFRSFPEALEDRRAQLYVPWSVGDAADVTLRAVDDPQPRAVTGRLADLHDGTLARICALMEADRCSP